MSTRLPDLSYMMRVGQLRHIQAKYERGEYRNPDLVVGELLQRRELLGCALRGRLMKRRLRASPFYRYVCARTKYYDLVFVDAIASGFKYIVNIGCGSDTRAYRFGHLLTQNKLHVIECDQEHAIEAKRKIVAGLWPNQHVSYVALDLNGSGVSTLRTYLAQLRDAPALVMLEGVSPYVEESAFSDFLEMLAGSLVTGSELAYDYKLAGVEPTFGMSERTRRPFRLSSSQSEVAMYHAQRGLTLKFFESSAALAERLVPDSSAVSKTVFHEDVLTRHVI